MAYYGFCSNEQLIKAIKIRFKDMMVFLVTAEILFLEEFYIFMQENSLMGSPSTSLTESGKQKFKKLPVYDKLRYIDLAAEINNMVMHGTFWNTGL